MTSYSKNNAYRTKAYTALAEKTYTIDDGETVVIIHAEHIAYEFYRVRRYRNGELMADENGSRSEMHFFLQLHADMYGKHCEEALVLPHYEGGETS